MWRYENAPGGLQTAGWYAAEWRKGIDLCSEGGRIRLSGGGRELGLAEFRAEMVCALNRRINAKVAPEPSWRKLDPEYQRGLEIDAAALRQIAARMRTYHLRTRELAKRFGHLLARYDD